MINMYRMSYKEAIDLWNSEKENTLRCLKLKKLEDLRKKKTERRWSVEIYYSKLSFIIIHSWRVENLSLSEWKVHEYQIKWESIWTSNKMKNYMEKKNFDYINNIVFLLKFCVKTSFLSLNVKIISKKKS